MWAATHGWDRRAAHVWEPILFTVPQVPSSHLGECELGDLRISLSLPVLLVPRSQSVSPLSVLTLKAAGGGWWWAPVGVEETLAGRGGVGDL